MKDIYILGAIIAYYLFTQTPQQQLAAAQGAQNQPGGSVALINVGDALTDQIDLAAVPSYAIPTVAFTSGVNN